jgi:hypothetical protein
VFRLSAIFLHQGLNRAQFLLEGCRCRGGRRIGLCEGDITYTGRPRVIFSLPPGAPRL